MLRLMAAWPFLPIPSQIHTLATYDSSKSSEIFHTSDAENVCTALSKQLLTALSSLRQVNLSTPKDHLTHFYYWPFYWYA